MTPTIRQEVLDMVNMVYLLVVILMGIYVNAIRIIHSDT